MLKSLFRSKKDDEPQAHETSPLGLVVGGAYVVDMLQIRLSSDLFIFEPTSGDATIEQLGKVDMGDNTTLWRFYAKSAPGNDYDSILQILTDQDNPSENIREIMLYQHFDRIMPQSDAEWKEFLGEEGWLRLKEWELDDGTKYGRTWFPDSENGVELVRFYEHISRNRDGSKSAEVMHECMSFARYIESIERPEHLLCSVVGNGSERTIEMWVGIDLKTTDLTVY